MTNTKPIHKIVAKRVTNTKPIRNCLVAKRVTNTKPIRWMRYRSNSWQRKGYLQFIRVRDSSRSKGKSTDLMVNSQIVCRLCRWFPLPKLGICQQKYIEDEAPPLYDTYGQGAAGRSPYFYLIRPGVAGNSLDFGHRRKNLFNISKYFI